MKIAMGILGLVLVLIILILWVSRVVSRRADDDMNRYLMKQQKEVKIHGCATRTTALKA